MPRSSSRTRVSQVALELFEADGYDAVTVQQIAEAAGVTERTVYRSYGSKLEILLSEVEDRTADFVHTLYRQPLDVGVVDALLDTIAATWPSPEVVAEDRRRAAIMLAAPTLMGEWMAFERRLVDDLADWIAHRTRRSSDDMAVEVFSTCLVSARSIAIRRWLADPDSRVDPLDRVAEALHALRSHPLAAIRSAGDDELDH
ncbi:MAG: TetR/AcrR family transcriptional regulator [Actinomycetota bacterium]